MFARLRRELRHAEPRGESTPHDTRTRRRRGGSRCSLCHHTKPTGDSSSLVAVRTSYLIANVPARVATAYAQSRAVHTFRVRAFGCRCWRGTVHVPALIGPAGRSVHPDSKEILLTESGGVCKRPINGGYGFSCSSESSSEGGNGIAP